MTRPNLISTLAWSLCVSAFFLEFGSRSSAGWMLWLVVAFVPPLVFAALSGGPPITIAEVLARTEDNR
jgi:hypothetical protein